jgi:tryptophan synthase alpha chain
VLARGRERFADELAGAGISGLIVPDLPLEEAPACSRACDAAGVALVPLVAPTTPDDRLAAIGRERAGFVYTVSVTGTTGERSGADAAALIARAKAAQRVPVALGFGISTPSRRAPPPTPGADGVIVGSRLVRAVAEAPTRARIPPRAARVVAELAAALVR